MTHVPPADPTSLRPQIKSYTRAHEDHGRSGFSGRVLSKAPPPKKNHAQVEWAIHLIGFVKHIGKEKDTRNNNNNKSKNKLLDLRIAYMRIL